MKDYKFISEFQEDVEGLLINNSQLSLIEGHINQFNPIRIMKMEQMEIRHSAILSWLLNPKESHGFGDGFLKAFLSESLKGQYDNNVNALDILSANLNDANVYTEWNHIDIFIECPLNMWAIIIENKVNSTQSKGQLKKYSDFVNRRFGKYERFGVFLSLNDEEPECVDTITFASIKYGQIAKLLELLLFQHKSSLSTKVYNFINYYLDVVKDLCDMNDETEKIKSLAKKVYQENKGLFDFIIQHSSSTEFQAAVKSTLGEDSQNDLFKVNGLKSELKFLSLSQKIFSFLPNSWLEILEKYDCPNGVAAGKWLGCEKWWSGYPLICWVQIRSDDKGYYLRLYAEVGPLANHELRMRLIECIENTQKFKFIQTAKNKTAKYSKFLNTKQYSKRINDPQDFDELLDKLNTLLKTFVNSAVEPLEKSLDKFISYSDIKETK